MITLQEAAERLGVHYMTAYRYVRTGRLPARHEGGRWEVKASDVGRLLASPPAHSPRRGRPEWLEARRRMLATLLAGDEPGAWALVESALAGGADPAAVHLELLAPCLREVGELWSRGRIGVADEHRASVVAGRLVARLGPRFRHRGRRSGTVVVAAVPGDGHALPAAVLSDLLRGAGFDVVDLGANTPIDSVLETARAADRLVAVCLSVSYSDVLTAAHRTIRALHEAIPEVIVLAGGPALATAHDAIALGADGWAADGSSAASLIRSLVTARDGQR